MEEVQRPHIYTMLRGKENRVKSKDLCKTCTEYSDDTRCEHKKDCELQKILKENNNLSEVLIYERYERF